MNNIFISGISSGAGKALALAYLKLGNKVYGTSRRKLDYTHKSLVHFQADVSNSQDMESVFNNINEEIDLAVLNAGVLGGIKEMRDSSINDLKNVMDINLWGQKTTIDLLIQKGVKTIIAMSSGAAVKGNQGWGGYALSKAALNMLIQLYAQESPETKFIALAPGLIDTGMQDHLTQQVCVKSFPGMQKFKDAKGTDSMPTPEVFANNFINKFEKIIDRESGSFIDLRKI